MRFVPFPLMENEPKRSRPELSAPAAPRFGPAPCAAERNGGEAMRECVKKHIALFINIITP